MDCTLPGSSVHGESPGKSTGVGCHALFQVATKVTGKLMNYVSTEKPMSLLGTDLINDSCVPGIC